MALTLPVWYTAHGTLLPPSESGDAYGAFTTLVQNSALSTIGLVGSASTSDVFAEILKSRTLHEAAIRRFDLASVYQSKGMDRAMGEFRQHLSIDVGRSGVITLSFEDRNSRRAADVANFLFSELDRFNREVYSTRAKRTREFLETRLADTQARLADAQSKLSDYEREHKIIAASDQASVDGAASVMAQKLNLQIRRSYVSEYAGGGSPAIRELDAQLSAVDRELGRLPLLKMEGARLLLEVEVRSKLFALISDQYEEARIQETRDTPTVTILDAASIPEIRSRPKRALIVAASVLAGLVLCGLHTLVGMRLARP
jgi:uncharacterized protein involved in exopolysaccharide biosynthesis